MKDTLSHPWKNCRTIVKALTIQEAIVEFSQYYSLENFKTIYFTYWLAVPVFKPIWNNTSSCELHTVLIFFNIVNNFTYEPIFLLPSPNLFTLKTIILSTYESLHRRVAVATSITYQAAKNTVKIRGAYQAYGWSNSQHFLVKYRKLSIRGMSTKNC